MSKAKAAAKAASKARKKPAGPPPPPVPPPPALPERPLDGLKVISAKQEQGRIEVVVEGCDLHKLMTPRARDLAYEVRLKYGMADAGIEPRGGSYIDDSEREAAAKEKRDVERWRRDFLITQML